MYLKNIIASFIRQHASSHNRVLIAFSGGPDSLALLHLLIEYQRHHPLFTFALAHVDHGWRLESAQEAQSIREMADRLKLTLYQKVLDPKLLQGNLEASCRIKRLEFFAELCALHGFRAVMLGHHADDLAETTFKSLLEGRSLPYLHGIAPVTQMEEMILWRPLLEVRKKELVDWLEGLGLQGFHDVTNGDARFLRARLRTQIFPALAAEYGKEIVSSLCRLSNEATELSQYLSKKVAPFLENQYRGVFGTYLDLSFEPEIENLELRYLVKSFCSENSFNVSRVALDKIVEFILVSAADKQIESAGKHLYIDRRRLFLESGHRQSLPELSVEIEDGAEIIYGSWKVTANECNANDSERVTDWHDLWLGHCQVLLPTGRYTLSLPKVQDCYPRSSSLDKWWTKHKIPAFLRSYAPVVYSKAAVSHEFLSGKRKAIEDGDSCKMRLILAAL